jgi:hypothetical protein
MLEVSTPHKRPRPTETAEAKAFRKSLLEDAQYLSELDKALKEFQEGKSKTVEEIEISRQRRDPESNR